MSDAQHNITVAEARRLYHTIKDIHDIFTKHGINYWVTGGTLIGAIRHRGIVPWDDDGDVCIMKSDVPKLRKLVPLFKKKGYMIEEGLTVEKDDEDDEEDEEADCVTKGKKDSCTWFIEPKSKNSLGVDVFIMERIGPIITYADPAWRYEINGGKACWFWYRYTFPLVPVLFGNFWVMTPRNAIEHLNQCYGPDWAAVSQRLYDHRVGKWIDSKKKRMITTDYATIPPPSSTCNPKPPSLLHCPKPPKPTKDVDELTNWEVKMIAKSFNIPNRSTKSIAQLKKDITKIV